jgi:hypothetical protein
MPHTRRDCGVLTRYEIHMHNNIFIVELFHDRYWCSACNSCICMHSECARQIEDQWQSEHVVSIDYCMLCGRLAKSRNGVVLCVTCSN